MKLTIKIKDGENICCIGISSESIKEFKAKIQEKERIPVQQYNLIYNGENLNDKRLLSDYNIQDDSILLLVNKEKSLLLKSSIIFDNSGLIDRIHQSIIDLKKHPHADDVLDLLNEAISYLDEDFKSNAAIELFSLIISCSTQYPDQSLQLFNRRLQKGNISSNHIISFAKLLSKISLNFPQVSIKNYDDFISNTFHQISQQILKSPDNNLIILENEIPPQFKNSFIADIISLINPTEQIVNKFSQYIINPKNDFDLINFFIKKVNDSGLLNSIPYSLLIKNCIYDFLTVENNELIIQSSTKQTFRNFLPLIENDLTINHLTPSYCRTILNKLIEYDISLSSKFNDIFFEKVDDIELDSKNLEYLKRHKIKLPVKFISKIESLSISLENIELFCNPERMPRDHLKKILYNSNDLNIYYKLLSSKKIMTDVTTKLDFWKHILTIISSTEDEIDDNLISSFSFYFQMNSLSQKEKICNGLIFDEHLPNEKQSNFLLKLFKQSFGINFENCLFIDNPKRLERLLSYNEIPSKSLCGLFLCPDDFLTKNPTPKELFFFIFSFDKWFKFSPRSKCSFDINGSNFFSIDRIKSIFNRNDHLDESNELLLTQFIKNKNDFSLISQFDEKTFSLVVASLAFGKHSRSMNINGVNKDNALPFYAIAFNASKFHNYEILNHSTEKMLNAFITSIRDSGNCNSPLLNESINSILSIGVDLLLKYDQSSFIFDILCNHLIHERYHANKLLLFNLIFCVSQITNPKFIELYLDQIVQYGIRLFKIVFQNKTDIINSRLSFTQFLDLKVFDPNEIKNYIENEFHKFDSDDEIFQAIIFYIKYCKNQPILNIDNITTNSINRLYQQKISDQKWDDFTQIFKFMAHNKMNINYNLLNDILIPSNAFQMLMPYSSYYSDIECCLYHCLNNPEFENKHSILIQLLLQNKSIAYKYVVASIEKLYPNIYIKYYTSAFDSKPYLNDQLHDDLRFVLKHLYAYDEKKLILIKKLNVEQPELPEIDYSIIDELFQLKNYRSFDCLHYIASCFPFLFEDNFLKVVNLVLPTFNCLSFIYDENIEMDDLKIAISALSFLYSCLQSTKFISAFIVWLFENIESLTEPQIVCMSRILIALFKTNTINIIICGYTLKYDFLDKFNNLLTKDVSNEIFRPFYFNNLYQLLDIYLSKVLSCFNYNLLFINQISDGSISNPFDIKFNFNSVIPISFQKLSFYFDNKNASTELIENFISNINSTKIFWLSHEQKASSYQQNSKFLINNEDQQCNFIYENLPKIKPSSTKIRSYLISKPEWAINLLTGKDPFPVLPEHYSFLNDIKNKAPVEEENNNDDNDSDNEENTFKALENDHSLDKIVISILKDYLYSEMSYRESSFQLNFLLNEISIKNICIEFLKEILLGIEDPPTFKLFYTNLYELLYALIEDADSNVKNNFFEKVGTKLINYFLSPYLIEEVSVTSEILNLFNCHLPIQTIHIIEKLITCDQPNFTFVFKLYSKIEKGKATYLIPLFTTICLEEMKKPDLDYKNISLYFKELENDKQKQLAKKNTSLYADCLSTCIHKYTNAYIQDQILGDFIIDLFNILAPERNNYQDEYSQESDEIDFTQSIEIKDEEDNDYDYDDDDIHLRQAPESFNLNNANFWQKIYEKHRRFLSDFLVINENNYEKLTFFHEYYELIPFEYRLSNFKKKISQLLNSNIYNLILINVSRSNILEDTFNQLNFEDPKDLIGKIRVNFVSENGLDEGGLTTEWFSLITKELLNPKYGLFISNENNGYHPNQLSYINPNHIDYFKLAGKIVALALLNNQNINAHLSIAFYRQILHQKIKLKDLENFDNSLFNSLNDILKIDDIKDLDLVFSIDDEVFGKVTSIDLIENGQNVQVTNDNRINYVSLYVNYKLRKSVIDQINAFCNAFNEIIPLEFINMFSPYELDLLICGVPNIDLEDMKKHTHYEFPYNDEHPTIIMLFNVLKNFTQEDLAKFLAFLTGSSQVPIGGFEIFEESGKPIRIMYNNNIHRLPVAHTCFRALDLPCYDDENDLKKNLLNAINECDDFGLI